MLHNKSTLLDHPTNHNMLQHTLSQMSRRFSSTLRRDNLPFRPQNQPAKHKYQNTATHYTTKTSIPQTISAQNSQVSGKKSSPPSRGRRKTYSVPARDPRLASDLHELVKNNSEAKYFIDRQRICGHNQRFYFGW
jgi:hypothetical protein